VNSAGLFGLKSTKRDSVAHWPTIDTFRSHLKSDLGAESLKRVVMFSGGIGSWAAAKRVAMRTGTEDLTLLFSDTLVEDPDLYRFLQEASENVGGTLVRISEGRTPWDIYRDERFLGNSRLDPCSKLLKRRPAERWLRENCDPADSLVYLGIDWTEAHRFERTRKRRAQEGWRYEAPLCEPPYLSRSDLFRWLDREGIARPRLYQLGFSHNNCGGFCCKAGQGHFAHLLKVLPRVYAEHEANEESMRQMLNRDVSILVDRRGGGKRRPLTLRQLRLRIEAGGDVDSHEVGGCGCFTEAG
jgi:3'-phosphoadenosine 5'-phosphosulfate sulfotransferase (PAPS reductase)/FAD synthetase